MGKRIKKDTRHLRWNWVKSPESSRDSQKVRYYFDVVDDKQRESKIEGIFSELHDISIINFSFEKIQELKGKVKGTNLRYLCEIYDSNCSPAVVRSAVNRVFGRRSVFDRNLYDRIKPGTSLEVYLEKLHS